MELEFARQIFENSNIILNLMKIRPVGAELFDADRQTDTKKIIVSLRHLRERPKVNPCRLDQSVLQELKEDFNAAEG
jgi:hypothetical protein